MGDYFREQMSREVAAACRGALAGGADDVLVKDAHDYARNIDPTVLPEEVKILRGWDARPVHNDGGHRQKLCGRVLHRVSFGRGHGHKSPVPHDEPER